MRGGKNERKRLYRQKPISSKLSGCTLCPSGGAALRRQAGRLFSEGLPSLGKILLLRLEITQSFWEVKRGLDRTSVSRPAFWSQ